MPPKRWNIQKHDHEAALALAKTLGVEPIIAALLIARGLGDVEDAKAFLSPSIDQLHDPNLLKGLPQAVERIERAIDGKEKVMIWGDYDVDGTTGTVLLRSMFRHLGLDTEFHVPNRFTEGYGVNIPALEAAKQRGVSLVITVDCGIRSFEPLEWAAVNGLDVIVTDHHLSDDVKGNPPAVAVVNPNQTGCEYPDKHLAGVGVAFKLAHALLREYGREELFPTYLNIAAIGTVADIMQLNGENRAIVSLGLADLPKTKNYGLKALMEAADCRSEMTAMDIGFRIGPRINAAGRMDVARHVVELLEQTDFSKARELAKLLDSRNRERQQMQQKITEFALEQTLDSESDFVVVYGDGWHRGVIGLAASRIAEKLHRPTLVFSVEDGVAHGSARSVPGFHLLNALDSVQDLLIQYGGHAAAAGAKANADLLDEMSKRLDEYARHNLTEDQKVAEINIDARLRPETISLKLVDQISMLEPFGAGNPKPVFLTSGLVLQGDPFVMKDRHLKLRLNGSGNTTFEAVWWDGVERSKGQTLNAGNSIEIAYTLEDNVWQGVRRLQLVIADLKVDN